MRGDQPPFEPKPRRPPLDELVLTVLSQNTSDTNSERAFASLRRRFPSWNDVAAAPVEEVEDAIRPGGLAPQKAPRIKAILEEVRRREGRLDLRRLRRMPDDEVAAYLESLPGVGAKTAACVLVFSLGRPAFPVDTHVHRVLTRLGLARSGTAATAVQAVITPLIPAELRYEFHVQLIRHGRAVCVARIPRCSDCVLFDLCEAGPSLLSAGAAR